MMVLLPDVHDDDEDNDGDDNDDDDGFLHKTKKKHKLPTCQSTNFDAFLTICDRFLCPFFSVVFPLFLTLSLSLLQMFIYHISRILRYYMGFL